MREHRVHAHFRKIAAGPYSFSNLKKMEPLVDENMRKWIAKIDDRFAKTHDEFRFDAWAM